jgi:BMFP domain-containing protein YqiC
MTDAINVGGEGEPDPKPAVERSVMEQSLRAQLDAMLAKYTALRDERDALRARVAELEARGVDHAEIGYAIAARMKAEAENTELRARVAALEASYQSLVEHVARRKKGRF